MSEKLCTICKVPRNRLYPFPKDNVNKLFWCNAAGIDTNQVVNSMRLCDVHFDSNQWIYRAVRNSPRSIKVLRKRAIPSLFLREPLADPDGVVPVKSRVKRTRCAVCFLPVKIAHGAAAIFDDDDQYTQIGVTLTKILNLTSRKLSSRHCCQICASNAVNCFDAMINLNVSTLLTNRKFTRLKDSKLASDQTVSKEGYEEFAGNPGDSASTQETENTGAGDEGEDGEISEEPNSSKNKNSTNYSPPVFEEQCFKCNAILNSKSDFSDHLVKHILEDCTVTRVSVAMTQTSEFEIDHGFVIDDPINFSEVHDFVTHLPVALPVQKETVVKAVPMEVVLRELANEGTEEEIPVEGEQMKAEEDGECEGEAEEDMHVEFLIEDEIELEENYKPVMVDSNMDAECVEEPTEGTESQVKTNRRKKYQKLRRSTSTSKRNPQKKSGGICDLCGRTLKSAESLKVHIARHKDSAEGPKTCEICGTHLKNSLTLMQHIERVHRDPRKNYKPCDLCGKMRGNLSQHRKNCKSAMVRSQKIPKGKKPRATCGVCGKAVLAIYLAKHLRLHEIEDDVAKNGPSALEKYVEPCPHCNKKVKNLPLHLSTIHNIKKELDDITYNCEHCGISFQHRPLLVNHLKLMHKVDPRILAADKSWSWKSNWKCSICSKSFLSYKLIRKHTKAEHDGVGINLSCESCGRLYNTMEALREHMNIKHLNYFSIRCAGCDRHFVSEEAFTEHATHYCRAQGFQQDPGYMRDEEQLTFESVTELATTENYSYTAEGIEMKDEQVKMYEYVPQDDAVVFYVDVD